MIQYFTEKTKNGSLNISENVFLQIAEQTLSSLMNGELKDLVSAKNGRKKAKNTFVHTKKGYVLTIEIFIKKTTDAKKCCEIIQQSVLDEIKKRIEVKPLLINVSLIGVLDN